MRMDPSQLWTPMDSARDPESTAGSSAPVRSATSAPLATGEVVAAPPAWFTRKKAAASAPPPLPKSHAAKPAIAIQPAEERELTWSERLVRWVVGVAAMGYATSFLIHLIAVLLLSFWVYTEVSDKGFSVLLTQAEGLDTELQDIDTRIELAGGTDMEVEMPHLQPIELPQQKAAREPQLPSDLMTNVGAIAAAGGDEDGDGNGTGTGNGMGAGDGLGFAMPQGGKVVSKGSFSAWTVPEDPAPGQNYLIVIQIELPEEVRRFPRRDLIGSIVIGTDGYRQAIPNNPRGFLPTKERQAQLVIPVPGAANLVRDTIRLQSKILKEKQTLQIVF